MTELVTVHPSKSDNKEAAGEKGEANEMGVK